MDPKLINRIRQLHALLQQVAAEVAAIRPLLKEEADRREEVADRLLRRLNEDHGCAVTYQSDLEASYRAAVWVEDVQEAMDALAIHTGALDTIATQAELAAWMLANRATVFELSSDDDSRIAALAAAARNALPNAPRYAVEPTARAVLGLPAEVAYPVIAVPRG